MSVRKLPNGKRQVRYRDATGKEHARNFDRASDAHRWEIEQRSRVNRGGWVDPALGRVTGREWYPTWLASKAGLKPTTRRDYEQVWRTQVEPRWGDVPLSRITYADVVASVAEISGGLSPSWTRQALLCLKQMLDLAVLDDRLARNVAKPVKAPRATRGEPRYLTHRHLAELAVACEQYSTLVLLAGYTGLRFGELRALRGKRIDLLRARIEVAENIPDGFDEAQTVAPKSHRRRVVPFPRFLVDQLAEQMAGKRPHDLLFTNGAGGLLDNSNFRRNLFDPAVRATGSGPSRRTTSATPPRASP